MRSIEWYHFQRPRWNPNPFFKFQKILCAELSPYDTVCLLNGNHDDGDPTLQYWKVIRNTNVVIIILIIVYLFQQSI